MGRIIKALLVGWIGKKIYDFTFGAPEPAHTGPKVEHRKPAAKRKTPTRRAA
jgi:hypothetical protein